MLSAIFDTKTTGRNPLNKVEFLSPTKYPVGFELTTLTLVQHLNSLSCSPIVTSSIFNEKLISLNKAASESLCVLITNVC